MSSSKIFLFLLFILHIPAYAQFDQPLRVEVELTNDQDEYFVIPAGEEGVITFIPNYAASEKKNIQWVFTGYSPSFEQKWKSAFVINDNYVILGRTFSNNTAFVLFGRENREDATLAMIDAGTGKITSQSSKLPRRFTVNSMKECAGTVYINGTWRNKAALVAFSEKTGKADNITLKFDGTGEYQSSEINSFTGKISIVYAVTQRRETFLNIKTFRGKTMEDDLIINPEGSDNLLTGKISTISDREKIIIGTYSGKGNSGSSGMYFARLIDNSQFVIKYYNFTSFARFFDFLPQREKEKIERKNEKKRAKGKELNLSYQLLVHDLIMRNGEYLLVAEAYYPTYRTQPYTYTSFINGVPIIQTRYVTVFDGWLYTHAIVAGFNTEGNMLWDNCIEMGDVKSFNLQPKVCVNMNYNNEITLVYATYEQIITKVIKGVMVVGNKDVVPIKTGFSEDVVKRSEVANIAPWYVNYFLVYGYQKIRNDQLNDVKRKRTVFYMNKLKYQ
jgi:hypothetical protein